MKGTKKTMAAPKGHEPYAGCEKGGELGGRPEKYTQEKIEWEADAFLEWMARPDSIWYKDFALERGYPAEYLSIWAKSNKRFSQVYERAKEWQQSKLVKGGLLNQFNAGFTKFVMSNTCGWTDRQQISGDAANPLSLLLQKVDGGTKDLVDGHSE
jgi:DNA-packaging protein gp3